MKWILLIFTSTGILGLGFMTKNKSHPKDPGSESIIGSFAPVAVLELFTSEGCSSCPAADKLLPQLANLDSNIIPLSFHVDYWNRLGWTDPFSSSEYSERQRAYNGKFNLESVYTPQLIVNGEYELIGSNRSKAESSIKKALKEKAGIRLTIDPVSIGSDKINFIVHPEGDFKKTDLFAALVQKHAIMNVRAGENSGAKLSHTNVVRVFSKQTTAAINEFELAFPKDLTKGNWQLVIYSQKKNDGKITGAVVFQPNQ